MTELRSAIKLLDGPEGGNVIAPYKGEGPDEIVVFRTQIAADGVLVCATNDGKYEFFEGDLIYEKVSRSELFDKPEFTGHPNVLPGCAYRFVRAVPAEECYEEPAGASR